MRKFTKKICAFLSVLAVCAGTVSFSGCEDVLAKINGAFSGTSESMSVDGEKESNSDVADNESAEEDEVYVYHYYIDGTTIIEVVYDEYSEYVQVAIY